MKIKKDMYQVKLCDCFSPRALKKRASQEQRHGFQGANSQPSFDMKNKINVSASRRTNGIKA